MTRVADATTDPTSEHGHDYPAAGAGGSVRLTSVEKRYGDFVALSDFDLYESVGEEFDML